MSGSAINARQMTPRRRARDWLGSRAPLLYSRLVTGVVRTFAGVGADRTATRRKTEKSPLKTSLIEMLDKLTEVFYASINDSGSDRSSSENNFVEKTRRFIGAFN